MDFWPKNGQIWPKTDIFGKIAAFFGPFDQIPDQKTKQTRCLDGFSVLCIPKLLLTPINIRFFGPKTANFGPIYAFVVILEYTWNIWNIYGIYDPFGAIPNQ